MARSVRVLISIAAFLLAWEGLSRSGLVNMSLFPPPTRVACALLEMVRSGDLARDIRSSYGRALLGFTVGCAAGIATGLLTGRLAKFDAYISPMLHLFRPLPPVAIIPLVIIWFGIGELSKIFSIAFAVFFPVWINTHVGARQIPPTFLWSSRTLGCRYPSLIWRVLFPATLPFIVAGLRVGVSLAFVMVFVSELSGASSGIGYEISVSYLAYRVDRMMAALGILALCGFASDLAIVVLMRRTFPWLKLDGSI